MSYDYLLCESVWFTAARDMNEVDRHYVVVPVLETLPPVSRYVTGGARGGDALIGQWLYAMYPQAEHVLVLPANRSQVDPWWERIGATVTLIEMPPGTDYADRNARGVDEGDATVGFPAYPEQDRRSERSGTWQTIRMAVRAGKLSQWYCVKPPYERRIEKYVETRRRQP
jgi:hypothetical protein